MKEKEELENLSRRERGKERKRESKNGSCIKIESKWDNKRYEREKEQRVRESKIEKEKQCQKSLESSR